MEHWISFIQAFLSFLSPIVVAWFTLRMNRISKENARIKELEDEQKAREKKELTDRIDDIVKQLNSISELTNTTAQQVNALTTVDQRFDDKVDAIARQQKLIGLNTHKLAQLVITIATGMRDQHLDGNITHAVDDYHAFERETLTGIMTELDS